MSEIKSVSYTILIRRPIKQLRLFLKEETYLSQRSAKNASIQGIRPVLSESSNIKATLILPLNAAKKIMLRICKGFAQTHVLLMTKISQVGKDYLPTLNVPLTQIAVTSEEQILILGIKKKLKLRTFHREPYVSTVLVWDETTK